MPSHLLTLAGWKGPVCSETRASLMSRGGGGGAPSRTIDAGTWSTTLRSASPPPAAAPSAGAPRGGLAALRAAPPSASTKRARTAAESFACTSALSKTVGLAAPASTHERHASAPPPLRSLAVPIMLTT